MGDALKKHWVPVRVVFPELDRFPRPERKLALTNIKKQGDQTLKKSKNNLYFPKLWIFF